jgi:sugar O-acyltransferase (sialic acid O-acetyltransferase NeuD family)
MTKLIILGASGHGKVVAEMAEECGFTLIEFVDDRYPELETIGPWPVVNTIHEYLGCYDPVYGCEHRHIVAIGHNQTRISIQNQLEHLQAKLTLLIHPSASVSKYANIGEGSIVMSHAVINAFAEIGKACIINTGAIIEHDCQLGHGVHISPNATLAGAVTVGELSWVGMGAAVRQTIHIGSGVTVGANSTVITDITKHSIVYGSPAKSKDQYKESGE